MVRVRLLHSETGFTLIELIVAMVIIGLLATIAIPNLRRQSPDQDRKEFVRYVNALSLYAMQRAIETRKVHKVMFDLAKRTLLLEAEAPRVAGRQQEFIPVKSAYLRTDFQWAPHLIFKNIFIDKEDKMRVVDKLTQTWFFITSDGLGQEVIINGIDLKDKRGAPKGKQFCLKLNPFTMQFKEYDGFEKP